MPSADGVLIETRAALADTEAMTANINTDIFFTKNPSSNSIEDGFIEYLSEGK